MKPICKIAGAVIILFLMVIADIPNLPEAQAFRGRGAAFAVGAAVGSQPCGRGRGRGGSAAGRNGSTTGGNGPTTARPLLRRRLLLQRAAAAKQQAAAALSSARRRTLLLGTAPPFLRM
jgi:hypothetical protein